MLTIHFKRTLFSCSSSTTFDTVLAVYKEVDATQCTVECVGGNDDHGLSFQDDLCSHGALHSMVVFDSEPPVDTFYVAVSGFDSSEFGTFELLLLQAPDDPSPSDPVEDDCPLASATTINLDPFLTTSLTGSTIGATPTLPNLNDYLNRQCSVGRDSPTVWYKLETDFAVTIDITTCSFGTSFDTVITIFEGDADACSIRECLQRNDDHGTNLSQCSGSFLHSYAEGVVIVPDITYYIAVSGFGSFHAGSFELQLIPHDFGVLRPGSNP